MVQEGDLVAIFQSMHRVMKAEKLLKQQRAAILLIPVPRQLSSDCGLAIRIDAEGSAQVLAQLEQAGLSPVELYLRRGQGFELLD